jgi:hypothetical protein
MRQPRSPIWTECAIVLLFLASLAGALNLVMAIHRRAGSTASVEPANTQPGQLDSPAPKISAKQSKLLSVIKPPIVAAHDGLAARSVMSEDPTKKALAQLAAATSQEIDAALKADRRTQSLEQARRSAIAESQRWRRREMLVTQQVSALAERAKKIDQQIDTLSAQRDALARERDVLKAAVASNEQSKGSYAVLPYKGPNGSWRRPIVLECSRGTVTLRPKGPTFSMLDLSSMINPRSSPVILAVARELLRIQMSESPDGSPVVPYFVFLVRPDGIRPYYEIRARLEPLGIAFGYELIDQNLKVDVPDFDNLATWDGTIPLEEPLLSAPEGGNNGVDDGLAWPSPGTRSRENLAATGSERASGAGDSPGVGDTGGESRSADEFVWPSQGGTRSSSGPGAVRGPLTSLRGGAGRGTGLDSRASSSGGGTVARQSGSARQTDTDPSLRSWPSRKQGSELGSSEGGGAISGAASANESGSARGGLANGTGFHSAGNGRGVALLPHLEPEASTSDKPSSNGFAGRLAAATPGAPDRPGSTTPKEPDASATGARSGRQAATAPEMDSIGTVTANPHQSSATTSMSSEGSISNPPVQSRPADTKANTDSSNLTQGANPPMATRGVQAVDPQTEIGLEFAAGSQESLSSASSTRAPSGAAGSSLPSMANAAPSMSSPSSLILGSDSAASTNRTKDAADVPSFKSRIADGPSRTIEVPFEIVVVCRTDDIVIHPGGYLLTTKSLEAGKKENIVVRELLAVVRRRAESDPTIQPRPRVKFLVENGGSESFWAARKQILFSGLGWPMSLQVSGAQDPHVLVKETW